MLLEGKSGREKRSFNRERSVSHVAGVVLCADMHDYYSSTEYHTIDRLKANMDTVDKKKQQFMKDGKNYMLERENRSHEDIGNGVDTESATVFNLSATSKSSKALDNANDNIDKKSNGGTKGNSCTSLMRHGSPVHRYECDLCNAVYSHKNNFFRHKRNKHYGNAALKCGLCGYVVARQDYLSHHKKTTACRRRSKFVGKEVMER